MRAELARNWKFLAFTGAAGALLGFYLLANPVFATGVAYDGLAAVLAGYGLLGVVGLFAAEKGYKVKSLLFGLLNLYIAYSLVAAPGVGLDAVTLTLIASVGGDGLYGLLFAAFNSELPGAVRFSYGLGGLASAAAAAYLLAGMPVTDLLLPGTALAASLISTGLGKVSLGLVGKREADALQ